jgi:hypothetical protein
MEELRTGRSSSPFVTTGVKTAALVVIIGVFAAFIDQSRVDHRDAPTGATPPPVAEQPSLAGFALPPDMHPNSADVSAPPSTF